MNWSLKKRNCAGSEPENRKNMMRKLRAKKETILSITLYIDFFITFIFGLVSWLFPYSTYGTIVSLHETDTPLALAAFSSLSIFYILFGIVCFLAARTPNPHKIWFAMLMIGRHGWIGIDGVRNANQEWIIGNPWTDIVIHSMFVIVYLFAIIWNIKSRQL